MNKDMDTTATTYVMNPVERKIRSMYFTVQFYYFQFEPFAINEQKYTGNKVQNWLVTPHLSCLQHISVLLLGNIPIDHTWKLHSSTHTQKKSEKKERKKKKKK